MSVRAAAVGLAQAGEELWNAWQDAKVHWADVKSAQFEQKYLADLPRHIAQAAIVIEEIDTLLRKVRNDCE
jgi:head-tail adaptor